MNLTMNLNSTATVDSVMSYLNKYTLTFQERCNKVCVELAEIGKRALKARYDEAKYAGTIDISVKVEPTDNGCILSARGKSVGFIEFGTGVSYPLGASAAAFGAPAHGTYGKGLGQNDSWVYVGDPGNAGKVIYHSTRGDVVRTSGNPAADAFTYALEEMRNNFEAVVQGVFTD